MKSGRKRSWVAVFLSMLVAAFGCAKADPIPDVQTPFGAPTPTTVSTSTGALSPLIPATQFTYGVIGTKDVGGRTYQRYAGGYDLVGGKLTDTTPGTEVWIDGIGTDSITISGLATHNGLGAILPDPVVVTLTEPVTVDIHPPVGTPQTQAFTGTGTKGNTVTLTANYQLVEENASVDTHTGTITGCRHFTGSVAVTGTGIPAAFQGLQATGELWYSPSLGVVAAKSPEVGMLTDLQGEDDWITTSDNAVVGRKVGVLDAAHPDFEFSTYDRAGALDTDMCVEAKMLAEVRWANDADAKTLAQPDTTLFGVNMLGGMGQFCWGSCLLVESDVSIFHPEDNGKGYKFWYTFVQAGVKNEYTGNGDKSTSYGISAHSSLSKPVRITARIGAALLGGDSDCSME